MSSQQKNTWFLPPASAATFLIVLVFMVSGFPVRAQENRREIRLKNGVSLDGPVLKEDGGNVFFDLGHDVLKLGKEYIEAIEKSQDGRGPLDNGEEGAGASKTVGDKESSAPEIRADFRSQTQMLDYRKSSVVIVSNPGGFGAGFLIDRNGRVLTNHHVVRNQQIHDITFIVKGDDGVARRKKVKDVELVAFSRLYDIALLQVPEDKWKELNLDIAPLPIGESAEVGDTVYAIGNPGMGIQMLDHTVSKGIVSSSNRNINDVLYLQTNAAVNPGNSGGPLISDKGEVIGLVTLKASFQENIAFALPATLIRLFLSNEKAYAADESNPNRSYRYLPPGRDIE